MVTEFLKCKSRSEHGGMDQVVLTSLKLRKVVCTGVPLVLFWTTILLADKALVML
jgi:hypothetical protein